MRINGDRISGGLGLTWAASVLALVVLLPPVTASAELNWLVLPNEPFGINDYSSAYPGDEQCCEYLIENQSTAGDANNLISLTIYAGRWHGVYEAYCSDWGEQWSYEIYEDRTVFQGNGAYIPPQGGGIFVGLYSTHLTTQPGRAEAESEANGPFPSQEIVIPAVREQVLRMEHGNGAEGWTEVQHGCGSAVTNSVAPEIVSGSTQYVCLGWSLIGGTPASGTSNSFSMLVTNDVVLSWQWRTNYWLEHGVEGHGGVTGDSNGWYVVGAEPVLEAVPAEYWAFGCWTGNIPGGQTNANPLSLGMSRPWSLTARFTPLLSAHGTPLWWLEGLHWQGTNAATELADPDQDGYLTWEEYVADTDPTNRASRFGPVRLEVAGGQARVSVAQTSTGRVYGVEETDQLGIGPWRTNLYTAGTGSNLIYTGNATSSPVFYRMRVRLP